jgi:large subunit ribosomal protein L13
MRIMSTYFPTAVSTQESRRWWVVDATGLTLGRLSTGVARLLAGKHNPEWTPFLDTGDHVVVLNGSKIVLTGRKSALKVYRRHTGYPGALKEITAEKLLEKDPVRLVEVAIKGMLPKTKLGRKMGKKLKVYAGAEHPHAAQAPEATDFGLKRAEV